MFPAGCNWSLWNWMNWGISFVFEWCGSDSLIRVSGRWIGSHLSAPWCWFSSPVILLFSQPCLFIWWQRHHCGADAGGVVRAFAIHKLCSAELPDVGLVAGCDFVEVLAGCRFWKGIQGFPVLIHMVTSKPWRAMRGFSWISTSVWVCVYVCLFAWLACQDIWLHPSSMKDYRKWQIKGLSLATWQSTENYSTNGRRALMCTHVRYMSVFVFSEDMSHPCRHKANHFCGPPKLPRIGCSPLTLPLASASTWEDDNVPLVLSGGGKDGK